MEDLDLKAMNLGDVIAALEALDPTLPMAVPLGFGSWRGRYNELTLHNDFTDGDPQTVGDLLALALAADGGTFMGYKGGDYTMDRQTPVWCDPYGSCPGYRPVGFVVRDEGVVVQRVEVGIW